MDNLKQYQAKYVCYASNELGTAVSNEAKLNTDGKNTLTTATDQLLRQLIWIFKFRHAQWAFADW